MKPRSIGVLCVFAVFATAPTVFAQQSKPSQEQKAPSAEAKANQKPNFVVFKLSGTPQPTPKWGRPKGVPRFRPLSNAEKLNIAHGVNPQISGTGTPVGRLLSLCWPDFTYFSIAHYVPATDFTAGPLCATGTDNPQHVAVQFGGQVNNAYLVDFLSPSFLDKEIQDSVISRSRFLACSHRISPRPRDILISSQGSAPHRPRTIPCSWS